MSLNKAKGKDDDGAVCYSGFDHFSFYTLELLNSLSANFSALGTIQQSDVLGYDWKKMLTADTKVFVHSASIHENRDRQSSKCLCPLDSHGIIGSSGVNLHSSEDDVNKSVKKKERYRVVIVHSAAVMLPVSTDKQTCMWHEVLVVVSVYLSQFSPAEQDRYKTNLQHR